MQTAGKVLACVFWDAQGILFIDFLEKEPSIALLVRLKEEIAKKRPQMKKKSALSPKQCTMSQVDRNNGKTT